MTRKRPTRRFLSREALEERFCLSSLPVGTSATVPDAATQAHLSAAYGQLPLSFEANQGQTNSQVNFLSRGSGYSLFLSPTKAVLSLEQGTTSNVVGMRIVGANPTARAVGVDKQAGVSNYLIGSDPSKWHTDISNYGKVDYQSIYKGIDLVYHGDQNQLEYDFVVAPGADPRAIRLAFDGMRSASLDRAGNLVLHTSGGDVVEHAPVVYQEVNGQRQAVAGRYVLQGKHQVAFQVGHYDHSKPLVIDPTLSYSTYLGAGFGYAIAVDSSGSAYVTGSAGKDFPTTKHSLQKLTAGGGDAFITKLNAAGTALVYSTFLGGSGSDEGDGIAVDNSGNAYVAGRTTSTDFPTSHAAQASYGGGESDAFVSELNAAGTALVYSTYLGGSGSESPMSHYHWLVSVALSTDKSGHTFAYVAGGTGSTNFPTTPGAYQRVFGGGGGEADGEISDAFVAKYDPAGAVVYASYFGGSMNDIAAGIAADSAGNAYLTGITNSKNLPTTPGAFQVVGTGSNAFVTKINPAGSGLVYSTYLGDGLGLAIAVDSSGNAYVTGVTGAPNFPTTPGAYQLAWSGGGQKVFLTKLNATGTALLYSTYLGGSGLEDGLGIAVDGSGNAYVTGVTGSTDFPTRNAFQPLSGGPDDGFVAELNPSLFGGASLVYSSYLGGSALDYGTGVAVDGSGNAYITGVTTSSNFPTKNPFQALKKAGNGPNPFVTKITAS